MADVVQKVERVGCVGALSRSIKNVFGGILLIIAFFPVVFFNEYNAVTTAKSLDEGAAAVMSITADALDERNEGALVHISGDATAAEDVQDAEFGLAVDALRLRRAVQMYQWEESSTTKTEGNKKTTTYRYNTDWYDTVIASDRFEERAGHDNPNQMPFLEQITDAANVTIGAFVLNRDQLDELDDFEVLQASLPPLADRGTPRDQWLYLETANPNTPTVGDVRIGFQQIPEGSISIVAKQVGNTFEPFRAKAGGSVSLITQGTQSAEEMFATAKRNNMLMTWFFRLGGFLMCLGGFRLVMGPLEVISSRIPLIGSLFSVGISLVSLLIAAPLTLFVIGLSWLVVRPVLAIVLLLAGGALLTLLVLLVGVAYKNFKGEAVE
jgi:hypothetical protein